MRYLLLLLLTQLYDCSKPPISPQTDALSNTNWTADAIIDSTKHQNIFYALSFSPDGKAEQFIYIDKNHDSGTPPVYLTYSLVGSMLTLIYPTRRVTGSYTGNQLLIVDQSINYAYKRQ